MGFLGYRSRTGFLAGLTVAQISEFSLILIALGVTLGHVPQEILSLVTLIGIITIGVSAYLITFSDKLYEKFAPYLKIFERKHLYEKKLTLHRKKKKYDIILVGYHRIGYLEIPDDRPSAYGLGGELNVGHWGAEEAAAELVPERTARNTENQQHPDNGN